MLGTLTSPLSAHPSGLTIFTSVALTLALTSSPLACGNDTGNSADAADDAIGDGDGDGDGDMGCTKVDFLFVIDNSGSMSNEQVALISSFPSFIGAMMQKLDAAQDYRVMVTDTDGWLYDTCQAMCVIFPNQPCLTIPEYTCGGVPGSCDVIGGAVTETGGPDSSNQACQFSSGQNWIESSGGGTSLLTEFACAAKVGTGGSGSEVPMEAMSNAVNSVSAANDCNQGFLRDDAILVVTFITDEDDDAVDGSSGTPDIWKSLLVAAKDGNEEAIVVLGLFGDHNDPNPVCDAGSEAEPSERLDQFIQLWGTRGFKGSICASNYGPFFASAVDIIDTTCDNFVPIG